MTSLTLKFKNLNQIIRYGAIGALNNLIGYCLYLMLTFFWLEPKVAISIFYPIGATISYFMHRKYSFSYHGNKYTSIIRYGLSYFAGYWINLMMLIILSDIIKIPHQITQALAIPLVALILFILLKYFVFPLSNTKGLT